jgi:hypothetical protein
MDPTTPFAPAILDVNEQRREKASSAKLSAVDQVQIALSRVRTKSGHDRITLLAFPVSFSSRFAFLSCTTKTTDSRVRSIRTLLKEDSHLLDTESTSTRTSSNSVRNPHEPKALFSSSLYATCIEDRRPERFILPDRLHNLPRRSTRRKRIRDGLFRYYFLCDSLRWLSAHRGWLLVRN